MKSAVCGCLLILVGVGCQPSRFLAGLNRHKDPMGFDDDDRWSDDRMSRSDRREDRDGRRPLNNKTQVARLILNGKAKLNKANASASDIADARRSFEDALQIDRNNGTAHHHLAMIADRQRRFRDAERHYEVAYKRDGDNPHLLCNIGYSYYLQGRYRESEKYLKLALREDPRHKKTLYNLGALYGKQGDLTTARRYFRNAGASERDIDDLIAGLDLNANSGRVRTAGGSFSDDDNRGFGAPRAGTSRPDINRIKELMATRRREGQAARRQRSSERYGSGGIGGRRPWNGDDERDGSNSRYNNRDNDRYDDRGQRNSSPNQTMYDRDEVRRTDWNADTRNSSRDPRDSTGYRAARYGDKRSDAGMSGRMPAGDLRNNDTYAPPPSGTNGRGDDRGSAGDRHLFPGNDDVGDRYGSQSPTGNDRVAARLPAADSHDDHRRGVTEMDRRAQRAGFNVGTGSVFPLNTNGNDGRGRLSSSTGNARSAVYYEDDRRGVRSAYHERNRRGDRSSYSSSQRPRYTEFRRGSESGYPRGDSTGYDDNRSDIRRESSESDIKIYPRRR